MCLPGKSRLTGGTLTFPEKKQTLPAKKLSSQSIRQFSPSSDWQRSKTSGAVHCWVLPYDFSQSRFGDRNRTSNACTFIALMLAKYFYHTSIRLPSAKILRKSKSLDMVREMLDILGNSILEGNDVHSVGMRKRPRRPRTDKSKEGLFTIPQAIAEVGGIHEIEFRVMKFGNKNLANYIRTVVDSPLMAEFSQVFILLIMVERAVLVTYDRDEDTIALIDGHAHQTDGAMIVASPISHLDSFCDYVLTNLFPDLAKAQDRTFEISVIQIVNDLPPKGVVSDVKPRPAPLQPVDGKIFPPQRMNVPLWSETETN